ncbi:MAG: RidA family protein [Candidatus Brocadiia bacterium]
MDKQVVVASAAPEPAGPYSQGVRCGELLFVAGQVPIEPRSGAVPEGIAEQTRQALRNVASIVEAAGGSLADVVKTTVFMADLGEYAAMNEVYATFFPQRPPARACVQVARLPRDARVEVEAVAGLPR